MCGIVGYVGNKNASKIIINSLKRLEYRGYDSAGIALFNDKSIVVEKKIGFIDELASHLENLDMVNCNIGMGHTRWATHGKPSLANAHPLVYNKVVVVHNGIIENYFSLRQELIKNGHNFISDTDTEVIAHLLDDFLEKTDPLIALKQLQQKLEGAYALGIMIEGINDKIFFIKNRCPLVVALGKQEAYLASDELALVNNADSFYRLLDEEFGYISLNDIKIYSLAEGKKEVIFQDMDANENSLSLCGHKHFMHKEIFEQPLAVQNLLKSSMQQDKIELDKNNVNLDKALSCNKIQIIACGSSYIAGLLVKEDLEKLLKIPTEVDFASEYRYKHKLTDENTLLIVISQSGETADTLAALEEGSKLGAKCLAITNVATSAIARFCKNSVGNIFLQAGIEISVASTKSFVSQVLALKLLSLELAYKKMLITFEEQKKYLDSLLKLPSFINEILKQDNHIADIAFKLKEQNNMLYIARGELYPIALEGALKMKELSYIAAQGYPAGELKHGPIATIDKDMVVVVLMDNDELSKKTMSNLCEVKARGASIIAVTNIDNHQAYKEADYFIDIMCQEKFILPIIAAVSMQLLAYHLAYAKGLNVDKPRNLAKSVTVE